jgi:sulfur-carrier protein
MTITVKFFAHLREQLGCAESRVDIGEAITVAEAWAIASGGRPIPANILMAVNMEYAGADTLVQDGDEVAFFPPVTGGGQL